MVPFWVQRFSKPPLSATQPRLLFLSFEAQKIRSHSDYRANLCQASAASQRPRKGPVSRLTGLLCWEENTSVTRKLVFVLGHSLNKSSILYAAAAGRDGSRHGSFGAPKDGRGNVIIGPHNAFGTIPRCCSRRFGQPDQRMPRSRSSKRALRPFKAGLIRRRRQLYCEDASWHLHRASGCGWL